MLKTLELSDEQLVAAALAIREGVLVFRLLGKNVEETHAAVAVLAKINKIIEEDKKNGSS